MLGARVERDGQGTIAEIEIHAILADHEQQLAVVVVAVGRAVDLASVELLEPRVLEVEGLGQLPEEGEHEHVAVVVVAVVQQRHLAEARLLAEDVVAVGQEAAWRTVLGDLPEGEHEELVTGEVDVRPHAFSTGTPVVAEAILDQRRSIEGRKADSQVHGVVGVVPFGLGD